MIDLQAAKDQIAGITREVLRRYREADRRNAVADELVETIDQVAEHLDVKMSPTPTAGAASSPKAGKKAKGKPAAAGGEA